MKLKRFFSAAIIAAMVMTILPVATEFTYAAAPKKPAQVKGLKKVAVGEDYVTIKWNKVKKNVKGYVVYRDGKKVARVRKNVLTYTDNKFDWSESFYLYSVKAYNTRNQYFNSKTKKWVDKKPKNGQWKGKRMKTKYVYGKESKYLSFRPKAPKNTRYNYEVKFFNQPYTLTSTAAFVKTNNPKGENFDIRFYSMDGKEASVGNAQGSTGSYHDIPNQYRNPPVSMYKIKVGGGYLHDFGFSRCSESTLIVKVVEYQQGKTRADYERGSKKAIEKTLGKIDLINYEVSKSLWINEVISKATNGAMTKREKMENICTYLRANSHYTKNYPSSTETYELLAEKGLPRWVLMEWNSYTSPYILEDFGEAIGYPVHSMYADYPQGSSDWWLWHSFAKSVEDGTTYSFCPYIETGQDPDIRSDSDIPKIDFLHYNKYYTCY